ncbi:MAG: GxxExxY protein [Gemmatimonadota bacterium]
MDDADGTRDFKRSIVLAHSNVSEEVIGAFFHVYNQLGFGLAESVYQSAMDIALSLRAVPCAREVSLTVRFEGHVVGRYRADLIVANCVLVETKAVEKLTSDHEAQVYNYLKIARLRVGLLLNFGPKAQFRRLILPGKKVLPQREEAADREV